MKPRLGNPRARIAAFTLIELLVVISIIALLAGLAVPVMNNLKPNVVDGATRQLLGDVARARQLAITHRTTVYMVFVPTNFFLDPALNPPPDLVAQTNRDRLIDKQIIGYNFVSLRSLGDQPGQSTARYYGPWKTLPEGVHIASQKFLFRNPSGPSPVLSMVTNDPVTGEKKLAFRIYGFSTATDIPFPAHDTPRKPGNNPYARLPYIAFNYLGQLTSGQNEFIPLTKGAVSFRRDPVTGNGIGLPTINESPAGFVTNAFNVVSIDWLTGRAHLERQQLQ